jgi:hypothetical protein
MSPAACAGSPPGPRSESPGTAGLSYAVSAASTACAGVQPGRVPGLEAADLEAGFCRALLKDVARGAVLARFVANPGLAPRLDGLWLRGVTERASWSRHSPSGSGSGLARPPLGVPAGRRIDGPGACRPASRAVTLPARPGTPSWSGKADRQRLRRTDCRTTHP